MQCTLCDVGACYGALFFSFSSNDCVFYLRGTAPAGFFFYRSNVRPNLLGVISQITLRRPRIRSARWRNIIRYCAEHGSGTMLKLNLDLHER